MLKRLLIHFHAHAKHGKQLFIYKEWTKQAKKKKKTEDEKKKTIRREENNEESEAEKSPHINAEICVQIFS